jgi:hypothetical protein
MSKIIINSFLFEGKLSSNIYLGANIKIDRSSKLKKWKNQEGDIPAGYNYLNEGIRFEIYSIDNIIERISTKFDYDITKEFVIKNNIGQEFIISIQSSLIDFVNFLNKSEIIWEIDRIDTRGKSIGIQVAHRAKIMYSFEPEQLGFYQISVKK